MTTADKFTIKKINDICKNFIANSDSKNLNDFLDVFDDLYPDWVDMYNERDEHTYGDISEDIDEILITKLPDTTTIEKYKVTEEERESLTKQLEKKVRILHISNKIAHGVAYMMKEYLGYFANHEIKNGNLNLENIMKFEKNSDGNIDASVDEKFFSDFIKNFPFDLDFSNNNIRTYFDTYTTADKKMSEVFNEIKNKKKRIAEVEGIITDIQERELAEEPDSENKPEADTQLLQKYLDKLRLKRRLESYDYLSYNDQTTLEGLCADRVALTNFISEETLKEVEEAQLEIYNLLDQKDMLKLQKEDAVDRAEAELGVKVDVSFSKLSRLRLKYDLDTEVMFGLSELGLGDARTAYNNCMDIKDRMIPKIHEFIQSNNMRYISYGISEEIEKKGKGGEKNVFLIDLPGYSQVSVHFLPHIIDAALQGKTPIPDYDLLLSSDGRREQVILINENTKAFRDLRRSCSSDYTIDKKMGFETMTRFTSAQKTSFRRLYGILSLDMDDEQEEKAFWCKKMGKGKEYDDFTDKQKENLRKKLQEARNRRRAARHQLGVMLGLNKNLLETLYDFESKDFEFDCRREFEGKETTKERNEVRIRKVFDKLLGRDRRQSVDNKRNTPGQGNGVKRKNQGPSLDD